MIWLVHGSFVQRPTTPPSQLLLTFTAFATESGYDYVTPTVDNATIIIPTAAMPTLANQPLPIGTLIGVFNKQ
jgi:hypothetical protein